MATVDQLLDGYEWEASRDMIEAVLRDNYPQIMELAYDLAGDEGLPVEVSFDVTNQRVKDVIDELATKVREELQDSDPAAQTR